jgi:hypothetical protein
VGVAIATTSVSRTNSRIVKRNMDGALEYVQLKVRVRTTSLQLVELLRLPLPLLSHSLTFAIVMALGSTPGHGRRDDSQYDQQSAD